MSHSAITPQSTQITTTSRKTLYTTSNTFEQEFGYHRAVRRGPAIVVSGTTALKLPDEANVVAAVSAGESKHECDCKVHHPDDAFNQALLALHRAIEATACLGGRTEDIIRVRMFVARSEDCRAVGAAFRRCFSPRQGEDAGTVTDGAVDVVGAAASMIVVGTGGFVDGAMLVEVEVDAYVL